MSLNSIQTALFNNLLEGKLLPGDAETLVAWLGNDQLDAEAARLISDQVKLSVDEKQITPELQAMLELKLPVILANKQPLPVSRGSFLTRNSWLKYAAVIILVLAAGVFFLVTKQVPKQQTANHLPPKQNDIAPGKEGAILTLGDGNTVALDSLGNGVVANQNGSKILLNNGKLIYNPDGTPVNEASYNTISTPKGRQFQLVLSDGSKVWLNAGSSLRYPAVFTGPAREVEVTGEVYFEVMSLSPKGGQKVPFIVTIASPSGDGKGTVIEVLGTHFNVNAYTNEASESTTLLEGSVRLLKGDQVIVLKPGQQAQVDNQQKKTPIKIVKNVDLEKVVAWKNGVFDFQDAKLEEVMRQVERWYDVEVVYEKNIPQLEFMGKMSKNLKLSEVIRGLELSKVHFRVEGRKLVVLP